MARYPVAAAEVQEVRRTGRRAAQLRRLVRNQPMAAVFVLLLLVIFVITIAGPWLTPYSPLEQDTRNIYKPPSAKYWLGTDWVGRDVLSRLIVGTRVSLIVGFASVLVGTGLGALWGLFSGYFGGKVDLVSQRFLEVLMAFPPLVLAIVFASALGAGLLTVVLAVAITRVAGTARVVRGTALSLRESDYVLAAKTVGATPLRVVLWHVAPGCIPVFLILLTANIGVAIVLEGTLGFLGVGVPPPAISWGNIMSGILSYSRDPAWWMVVFPGLAITVAALAFNIVGDGLRDIVDPRLRGSTK